MIEFVLWESNICIPFDNENAFEGKCGVSEHEKMLYNQRVWVELVSLIEKMGKDFENFEMETKNWEFRMTSN